MSDEAEDESPLTIPVPEIFWSFETDSPIRECLVCGEDLFASGNHYLIEKAFAKGEVLFEYALCLACHASLMQELSANSRKLIQNYFEEHVQLAKRREQISSRFDGTVRPWLSHCLFTQQPVPEDGEFQILGVCLGEELVLGDMPHAISGAAIEDIINLLSDQTKGFMDDFTGRHFGVPSGADLPRILPL